MFKEYTDAMDFSGRKIAVLGGAGLLGRAVAECLAAFKAVPAIVDLSEEQGQSVVETITAQGGSSLFYKADLSCPKKIPGIVAELEDFFGDISGWVLTFYPRTKDWGNKLEDVTVETWCANVDMQLNATCVCASEIAARLAKRGGGSIVNVGSIYGMVAPNFHVYIDTNMTSPAAYSAIKGGISAYSKYLASYYGAQKVRVNTVIPGGIANNQPELFVQSYSAQTCLGRLAQPREVASAVVYLLSDAASYITGLDMSVDGGFTAL